MNGFRGLELVVDRDELRVTAVVAAEPPCPLLADLRKPPRFDREANDLERVDLEERGGWLDPLHDRHVRGLVAEVAEVHRQRRLRRSRDANEDDVRLAQPTAHP